MVCMPGILGWSVSLTVSDAGEFCWECLFEWFVCRGFWVGLSLWLFWMPGDFCWECLFEWLVCRGFWVGGVSWTALDAAGALIIS